MARRRKTRRAGAVGIALLAVAILLAVLAGSRDTLLSAKIPYLDEILYFSAQAEEDPALILAMIQTESSFRQDVVSAKGAVGLMQVMPDTGQWMAGQLGLDDYSDEALAERQWNLLIGIAYVSYLRQTFPDSLPQAVAAYNAGPARVRAWLDEGQWDGTIEEVERIPFKETSAYVKKVIRLYRVYSLTMRNVS